MKPFLKWAGGKTKLLPEIIARLPANFSRLQYHEPFLGGGSVFLGLAPTTTAWLCDANEQLINVYRVVRDAPEQLVAMLEPYESAHSEDLYYGTRRCFNEAPDRGKLGPGTLPSIRQAARFIYLNKAGFNGLYRESRSGAFNTPWGHRATFVTPELEILSASKALQYAQLAAIPFEGRSPPGHGSFIYADPPYDGTFTAYRGEGFDTGKQARLAGYLRHQHNLGGVFMTSNSDTQYVRNLYAGFNIHEVTSRRGMTRTSVDELLITNY
jgi:DNA adenine methylase